MANSLINGTPEPAATPAPTSTTMVPTWGYDAKTGAGKLFDLAPGTSLPEGYVDSPTKAAPAPAAAEVPTDENTKPDKKGRS